MSYLFPVCVNYGSIMGASSNKRVWGIEILPNINLSLHNTQVWLKEFFRNIPSGYKSGKKYQEFSCTLATEVDKWNLTNSLVIAFEK